MFAPMVLSAHNPSPMTGAGNNTYLVAAADGAAALIDAGVGESRHLAELASALAARRSRLDLVLVTHGHRDHAAGVSAIAAAHRGVTFAKRPWPEQDDSYPVAWTPIDDGDVLVAGGEPIVVRHMPGHSPDHLAFWHEASRTAFTGDLLVAGGSVMIHWSRGGDLGQYLASLERLLALQPRVLLPAHGARIDDPADVIHTYLEHRAQRERQVLAALRAGRATVQAIAETIYDGLDPALLPAARENVRAHLEKLRAEGRANNDHDRWTL
jgi:glyoxylase-like metal-dependent hydrolase (beta-lactamase superfamily II)